MNYNNFFTNIIILCLLPLFFVSCTVTTQDNSSEDTQEDQQVEVVAEEVKEEENSSTSATTTEKQNNLDSYSLNCQGLSNLQLGKNTSTLKENFEPSQVEFWEDGLDGPYYNVKLEEDLEVWVYYEDGKDNSISTLQFNSKTPKLKFEDVYVGMPMEELNTYLATPVECAYNEELGLLVIEAKNLASSSNNNEYACITLVVEVGNNEAFVAANPKFKSDMPEFLQTEPYIQTLYLMKN